LCLTRFSLSFPNPIFSDAFPPKIKNDNCAIFWRFFRCFFGAFFGEIGEKTVKNGDYFRRRYGDGDSEKGEFQVFAGDVISGIGGEAMQVRCLFWAFFMSISGILGVF
jgi:hypothetical protein